MLLGAVALEDAVSRVISEDATLLAPVKLKVLRGCWLLWDIDRWLPLAARLANPETPEPQRPERRRRVHGWPCTKGKYRHPIQVPPYGQIWTCRL